MRKRISLKTRRPGLSPGAFRDHYENRHVPLGLAFVDRFQWRRYVRNYVLEVIGAPIAFDGYTEFWVDDDANDEVLARFVASPEFEVLKEDDRRFLDVEARFSCEVVEVPFGRNARDPGPDAPAAKVALLWKSGPAPARDVAALARRITEPVADGIAEATLEEVVDPPPTAPFDTLLTLRLAADLAADLAVDALPATSWSLLTLDPVETPADRLFGGSRTASADLASAATPSERTLR
ncbi:MAG: EthD domain-containing protein [Deltaproteobacteria bacterium]|jgi:hypothetical protein|nr:EthD domain-containing protein [Deltaproteobacteria bacterium]